MLKYSESMSKVGKMCSISSEWRSEIHGADRKMWWFGDDALIIMIIMMVMDGDAVVLFAAFIIELTITRGRRDR